MRVTLLGTGEAMGVPPVFVDRATCDARARRRRAGLLVETDDATVVLDLSPDVAEGLRETGTNRADAAFLTHFHRDHAGGLAIGQLLPFPGGPAYFLVYAFAVLVAVVLVVSTPLVALGETRAATGSS